MSKQQSPNIKIYISCHKPSAFIDSSIFQPIKVGADSNKAIIPKSISDNTGNNISKLNPKFCELTAQYWAWKNSKHDFYGFFHYRRYLSFSTDQSFPTDAWGSVIEEYPNEIAVEEYTLTKTAIENLVTKYDIILPEKRDITSMPEKCESNREQFLSSGFLHKKDLDIMMDVIQKKYPDYYSYAEKYLQDSKTYLNNMFIMKKDLFNQYCTWLFDILFECEKRIDYKDYSVEAIRTPGHLAERLLNIYLMKLFNDNPDIKIKELQTIVFANTEPIINPKPAFEKNNIPIALSADNYYVPYISTLINSIKANASKNNNYDIIIMHKDISPQNQNRIQRVFSDIDNIKIRFINVIGFNGKFEKLFLRGHFTIETWFRLLMPDLFIHYDKILYLDSDLVANADIAELYKTNINDYLLAACHDADTAGLYNGFEPKKKRYMDKNLQLDSPYDYFQAGVILFNLQNFRRTYTVEYMLKLAASKKWELLDQDVLNVLAKNKVKYVDMCWNVMFDWRYIRRQDIISLAPKYLSDEYDKAHSNPKIIHFAGPDKPWSDPCADYADLFWAYSKGSGFYEEIIRRMAQPCTTRTKRNLSPKFLLRRHVIDKLFPYDTRRREKAIKFYLKIR